MLDGTTSMTVGSRLTGVAALGRLSGLIQSDASTNALASVDPMNTYGTGRQRMDWSDQVTITSGSQPVGTPVQFLAQLELDSHLTNIGGEVSLALPSEPAFVTATATVGGTTLMRTNSLAFPLIDRSITALISTSVGATLVVGGTLQMQGTARLKLQTPVSVTADAANTAIMRLTPVTPGASYVTASGRGPYVPDSLPPFVSIAEPDRGEILRGFEPVIVLARDNGSGVARVQVWAGAALVGECDRSPCRFWLDSRRLPEGVGGIGIILAGVLMNMDIYFRPTSLWTTIVMFGLIAIGLGVFARALRPHRTRAG